MSGAAKAKPGRGDAVVHLDHGPNPSQIDLFAAPNADRSCPHQPQKAGFIKPIIGLPDPFRASPQIDRRGYRANACQQCRPVTAQFAGQFRDQIAAQRKTNQPNRAALSHVSYHRQQIRGEPAVIADSGETLRAAAGSQIQAVDGISRCEAPGSGAEHIACLRGTFESVNQDDFAPYRARGTLAFDQHLNIRLRAVQLFLDGRLLPGARTRPIPARDGLDVRFSNRGTNGGSALLHGIRNAHLERLGREAGVVVACLIAQLADHDAGALRSAGGDRKLGRQVEVAGEDRQRLI